MSLEEIQSTVLDWYAANGRDLAFRRTDDPWAILVSEVIAQQTQAARAAEAWTRFIAQFPTPGALAAASPATVIRAWRGLGYNRRAIALRAAAARIVEEHGGRVPDSHEALEALPGVGPYTARAVLAIAFGRPVAALDTNIRRVLGRAFNEPPLPATRFQSIADGLVPADRAADWTHALMDIGAAFCRAGSPRCDRCPLRTACAFPASTALATHSDVIKRRRSGSPKPRFESTTRWLRGRIIDRLRDASDGTWETFDQPLGSHPIGKVLRELDRLRSDGLIECDPGDVRNVRLVMAR